MTTSAPTLIVSTHIDSPVGRLVAAATDDGICLLEFAGPREHSQTATLAKLWSANVESGSHPHIDRLRDDLTSYFAGTLRDFSVPIVSPGTPFQERVWAELRQIPFGATRSYEDVAKSVGSANAVRAVGTANGRNRIAIVIPCHRVINKGGGLGGYGGGLDRKQFLLDLERRSA